MIANPEGVGWQPFDPMDPGRFVANQFFDLSEFERCSADASGITSGAVSNKRDSGP
jgi:hypothetical protein